MNYKFKPSHIVPAYLFVVAVLYGGSKPPATTNEAPSDISCDLPTNDVDAASSPRQEDDIPTNPPPMMCMSPRPMMSPPPEQTEPDILCSPSPSTFTSITAWSTRGAYCDWVHVTFPDGFAFPAGTNLLTGITVMAYGELRENLHSSPSPSTFTLNLPQPVSIEPDNSSVSYGLTASNSMLFIWQNVCVNRSPTNRVNAAIELFRNGDLAITTTPLSTTTPPTYTYLPAVPPEGFVGQGQDDAWLAATFPPTDYAAITNKGYARWLDEDYVGYNEENGHCRGTVTVHAMPPNGQPCYLVCGPHKMVVTEPGDYDFPVEVLTDIHIRTYPTSVPVSFSYDEGYYPDDDDYGPLNQSNNPNNLLLLGAPPPTSLTAFITPAPHLLPSIIPLEQALNTSIHIWCNMRHAAWRFASWVSIGFMVTFDSRNIARITDATTTYGAEGIIYDDGHPEVCASISLIPSSYPWTWPRDPDPSNGCHTGGSDTNSTSNGQTP